MRCGNHTVKGRTWDDYVLVDDFGTKQYFACKECKKEYDILAERDERIYKNEQKQKEASNEKKNKIYREKWNKRKISRQRDLWDDALRISFLRGMKGENAWKTEVPKELLQLIRATMKLSRLIKIYSKQPIISETSKCKKHGSEYLINTNINSKKKIRPIKCRECAREDLEKSFEDKANAKY
jgi:hypothetical protein